jgi:hypothetical protein
MVQRLQRFRLHSLQHKSLRRLLKKSAEECNRPGRHASVGIQPYRRGLFPPATRPVVAGSPTHVYRSYPSRVIGTRLLTQLDAAQFKSRPLRTESSAQSSRLSDLMRKESNCRWCITCFAHNRHLALLLTARVVYVGAEGRCRCNSSRDSIQSRLTPISISP